MRRPASPRRSRRGGLAGPTAGVGVVPADRLEPVRVLAGTARTQGRPRPDRGGAFRRLAEPTRRVYRRRFQGETGAARATAPPAAQPGRTGGGGASRSRPSSSRVDWAKALLAARHPSTRRRRAGHDRRSGPGRRGRDPRARRDPGSQAGEWLDVLSEHDQRLVDDLREWSAAGESSERALPSRLARRVEPYAPLLLGMLSEAV